MLHIQQVIVQSRDGLAAAAQLQAYVTPIRARLERQQNELQAAKAALPNAADRAAAQRRIDQLQAAYTRDVQATERELEQKQSAALEQLGQRLMKFIGETANASRLALIVDSSANQLLYEGSHLDFTSQMIRAFDEGKPFSLTAPETKLCAVNTRALIGSDNPSDEQSSKLMKAVEKVAQQHGLGLVFDSATFAHLPLAADCTEAVRARL